MKLLLAAYDMNPRVEFFQQMFSRCVAIDDVGIACTVDQIIRYTLDNNTELIVTASDNIKMVKLACDRLRDAKQTVPPVVMVSPVMSPAIIHQAIIDGFHDVIHADGDAEETIKIFRAVLRGDRDIRRVSALASVRRLLPLGHRVQHLVDDYDLDILRLITQGKSNAEIAEIIIMARQTVSNRVSRILNMTGANNRASLAVLYLT